jgi:hypothetical protein
MGTIAIILIPGLLAVSAIALLIVAMGKVAARVDAELEEIFARRISGTANDSYAGLALAQATISLEPSTTVPPSRTSVGTQRLPVSSCTSRRPLVWLSTPGKTAAP